jgi:hypothetical protein
MADDSTGVSTAQAAEIKSLRTVFIGSNLIFWILAIYIINVMNKMNDRLNELNTTTRQVMTVAGGLNLEGLQIVTPDDLTTPEDESTPVYEFRRVMADMMMMDDEGNPLPGDPGMVPPPPPPTR